MALQRSDTWVAVATWGCAAVVLSAISAAVLVAPAEVPHAPSLGGARWLAGLGVVTAQAVLLLVWSSRPRRALVAVSVAAPLGAALGLGAAIGSTTVAVMVAAFRTVTTRGSAPSRPIAPAIGAAALLVAAGELVARLRSGDPLVASVGPAVLQGASALTLSTVVALVVTWRRETRTALRERARAVAGEQAALVEAAVNRERSAMARELHDMAAHHLTGIAVMSASLGRQIDADPEGAKRAVAQVREQTTEMLQDMRSLVGLLRRRDEPDPYPGGPGSTPPREESWSGITALAAAAAQRGEDVSMEVVEPDGPDPRPAVGPLAQLSAYRTAQEALTNAARHAPGQPCRVRLDASSPDVVVLSVWNATTASAAPAQEGGGFGLLGMRERAELTGSHVTYGPADGGWSVRLEVPVRVQATLPEGST